ncbi:uncharacterized protein LACBIDRAFT_311245 [Laccaria bicolor S238N-H82]|uniref:Predicted protein n=1 Tax=Laccaria bicolor (strain S238N-H82 / ATCC MYA-4686) TaxID=486041 RepID=B0CZJ5_LACBS|nr:uncharacterized protein LACBIDRAFT_311245 [Laccaria bicolor S238N-H82]EDR12154.1 predicted protein [Laccaria bicolor S238N-H82]|eukprot:XP_001876418.1 predicted protein [Laccaria bicolor S238N-H82]
MLFWKNIWLIMLTVPFLIQMFATPRADSLRSLCSKLKAQRHRGTIQPSRRITMRTMMLSKCKLRPVQSMSVGRLEKKLLHPYPDFERMSERFIVTFSFLEDLAAEL